MSDLINIATHFEAEINYFDDRLELVFLDALRAKLVRSRAVASGLSTNLKENVLIINI
jgi:hypothetical protein